MISIRWFIPFLLIPLLLAALLAFYVPAPVHYFDEGGNLANALAVLGISSDAGNPYYFAYPMVISPAFLLFEDARLSFRLVQLINLAIYSGTCLFIALIARKLWRISAESSPRVIYSIALVACLYPPFVFFNSMVWSESLIYLFVAVACFCLLDYLSTRRMLPLAALAICLGMITWIHPRLIPLIPAFVLAFLLIHAKSHSKLHLTLFVAIALSIMAVYQAWIHPYFESIRMLNIGSSGDSEYAAADILAAVQNFTMRDYLSVIARFFGQVVMFNINGFFLPGMAITRVISLHLQRDPIPLSSQDKVFTPLLGFLVLSMLGVAAFVALFFQVSFGDQLRGVAVEVGEASFNNRIDHWVYGRYTDVFLPMLLVISAFYLDRKSLVLSVLMTIALAMFTVISAPATMWAPNYVNILGLWSYHLPALHRLEGFVDNTYLMLLLLAGVIGNFLISFVFLKRTLLPACIAAVFILTAVQDLNTTRLFEKYTTVRYTFGASMRARLKQGSCIFADIDSFEVPHGMYAFAVTPHALVALNPDTQARDCQGLITLRPEKFDQDFEQVTQPTDKFIGMVRKINAGL